MDDANGAFILILIAAFLILIGYGIGMAVHYQEYSNEFNTTITVKDIKCNNTLCLVQSDKGIYKLNRPSNPPVVGRSMYITFSFVDDRSGIYPYITDADYVDNFEGDLSMPEEKTINIYNYMLDSSTLIIKE